MRKLFEIIKKIYILRGLLGKLVLLLALIVFINQIVLTSYYLTNQKRIHTEEFLVQGQALADFLSDSVATELAVSVALEYFSPEGLARLSERCVTMAKMEDISYAAIISADGETIASSRPMDKFSFPSHKAAEKETFLGKYVLPLPFLREKIQDINKPIMDFSKKEIARVHIGVDLSRVNKLIFEQVDLGFAVTLILTLIAITSIYIVGRKIINRPLNKVIEVSRKIAGGDLSQDIQFKTHDEIGQLAMSFNTMTAELRKSRKTEEEFNRALISRINELERKDKELRQLQTQLVQSTRMAAIGRLASGVGHELRNPLGVIGNAIYYVRDVLKKSTFAEEDPALKEFLDIADSEIRSATRIISDLLDFSRVVRLQLRNTNINSLVKELQHGVEVPPHVKIMIKPEEDLPNLSIDPIRIKQVFVNLAVNAIQAMSNGGTLTVRTQKESADHKSWVRIEFEDQGEGMSHETLSQIFEPLFTTKAKGTGLGLAICRGIIEAHNGRISVVSEIGKGSTFSVRLPFPKDSLKSG